MVAASAAGRSTRALLMNEGKDDEASWWIPAVGGWKSVGENGLKDVKYTRIYIYIYVASLKQGRLYKLNYWNPTNMMKSITFIIMG